MDVAPTTEPTMTTTTPIVTVAGEPIPGYELVMDRQGRLRGYIVPGVVTLAAEEQDVAAHEVRTDPEAGALNGYFLRRIGFIEVALAEDPVALQRLLDRDEQQVAEDEACRQKILDRIEEDPPPVVDCQE